LRRGDLITIALSGDFGKPRPAVVIQSDRIIVTDTILVCLVTSDIQDFPSFRLNLPADAATGLAKPSQIMVDKIFSVMRRKCGPVFGHVDRDVLDQLRAALGFMIGFDE
jgi:mRNA interferase MazF